MKKTQRTFKGLLIALTITIALAIFLLILRNAIGGTIQSKDFILYMLVILEIFLSLLIAIFWIYGSWELHKSHEKVVKQTSSLMFEQALKSVKAGIIYFDSREKIVYVSEQIYEAGFIDYLGKSIKDLSINLENAKTQNIMNFTISINKRFYELSLFYNQKSIIVRDITELKRITQKYADEIIGFIITKINFLSDQYSKDQEINASKIMDQFYGSWIEKFNGYVVTDYSKGDATHIGLMKRRNLINGIKEIDKVRRDINEAFKNKNIRAVLSFGIAYGKTSIHEIAQAAEKSLSLADTRGSDQIVIDEIGIGITIKGGEIESTSSQTKIRNRGFAEKIVSAISQADSVLITGHTRADLDALAGVAGIIKLCLWLKKKYSYVFDAGDFATNDAFANQFPAQVRQHMISPKQADKLIKSKTNKKMVIFVVDTSVKAQVVFADAIEGFNKQSLYVIDHHRASIDSSISFIKENSYVDSGASSTAEILTEMLCVIKEKYDMPIEEWVSNILLSGIYLDTKELTRHVGFRTFEAAAQLKRFGANEQQVHELFKSTEQEEILFKHVMENITKLSDKIIVSSIPDDMMVSEVDISRMADRIIEMRNVQAAFVVGRVESNRVKASGRSTEAFNVQHIAESLGGGGHYMSSAISKVGMSTIELAELIEATISKFDKDISKTITSFNQ